MTKLARRLLLACILILSFCAWPKRDVVILGSTSTSTTTSTTSTTSSTTSTTSSTTSTTTSTSSSTTTTVPADPQFNDPGFNLAFWLKADTGTYGNTDCTSSPAGDGAVVKCWKDQSGNGYDVINSDTDIARIAPGTHGLTGRSYINNRQSGTSQLTIGSADSSVFNFTSSQAFTIYARFSVNDAAQSNYILFKGANGTNAGFGLQQRVLSGTNVISFFTQDTNGTHFISVKSSAVTSDTAYSVWLVDDGSNTSAGLSLQINGADDSTRSNSGTVGTQTNSQILAVMGNGTNDANNLNLQEVALFTRALSGSEITAFNNGYLDDQY